VHGEIWNAISRSGHINKGEAVKVILVKDLTIYVEQIHSSI